MSKTCVSKTGQVRKRETKYMEATVSQMLKIHPFFQTRKCIFWLCLATGLKYFIPCFKRRVFLTFVFPFLLVGSNRQRPNNPSDKLPTISFDGKMYLFSWQFGPFKETSCANWYEATPSGFSDTKVQLVADQGKTFDDFLYIL